MRDTLITLGAGATLILGGVDATVLDEKTVSRVEIVGEERVEAKQIGNVVETTFPWKDQPGLTVKVDLGEPTLEERLLDKRKREVITETVSDFEGGFKVDIILNERPDTNRFCYDIEGAENYDFFYQPPLTEEEIAEGASRPDHIVGSYAVYHKQLKNHRLGGENYATGKVMHIPRPQVWELDNEEATKEWAELSYTDEEGLCVTVRQEFLDKATYPVRVDPTFGYTTIGGNGIVIANSSNDTSAMNGYATSLSANGVLMSIHAAFAHGASTSTIDLYTALFDENSVTTGEHDKLIGLQRDDVLVTTSSAFYVFPGSEEVLPSGEVILAAAGNGEDLPSSFVTLRYDNTSSRNIYSESSTGTASFATRIAEDPWTEDAASSSLLYSIYVTYFPTDPGTYTDTYSSAGTYAWTPPSFITEAFVQCWGAGGGGGAITNTGGGGGGGGAYAAATTTVTPGFPYPVVIGAGGPGDNSARAASSSFGTTTVFAEGGGGTAGTAIGTGGSTANSSGTIEYAGGNGSLGNTTGDIGGGGGGAAGPDGAGVTPSAASSGVGADGGAGNNGLGGAGGTGDSNGSADPGGGTGGSDPTGGGGGGGGDDGDPGGPGGLPGGGGGGGEVGTSASGGAGQCTITYTIPEPGGGGGGASSTPQAIIWFD